MTVGDLLDRISSAELTEWAALWSLRADEERIGQARAEAQQRARRMAGGR